MAKSNKSKFAIMGMLAIAPKSSGYDIKKLMDGSTQYFWKETYSSIYPVLRILIEDKLIVLRKTPSNNGRQRDVYELTPKGRKELQDWLNKPVENEQFRNELLLKLFFGEFVPPSTTRKHVEEFHQMLIEKDKIYHNIKSQLLLEKKEAGHPYWLMTLDFGINQVKSALEWCESALKQYDKLKKGK